MGDGDSILSRPKQISEDIKSFTQHGREVSSTTYNLNVNQCQGCMAGWEIVETCFGTLAHKVEGGYNGELVGCTKHLYKEK